MVVFSFKSPEKMSAYIIAKKNKQCNYNFEGAENVVVKFNLSVFIPFK